MAQGTTLINLGRPCGRRLLDAFKQMGSALEKVQY